MMGQNRMPNEHREYRPIDFFPYFGMRSNLKRNNGWLIDDDSSVRAGLYRGYHLVTTATACVLTAYCALRLTEFLTSSLQGS